MSDDTAIETQYGQVDRKALGNLQNRYDTTRLLTSVDELDQMAGALKGEDGIRDSLLRLHGMAHVVINGALSGPQRGDDTLPELVFDLGMEIRDMVSTLQRWLKVIEPLEALQPDD